MAYRNYLGYRIEGLTMTEHVFCLFTIVAIVTTWLEGGEISTEMKNEVHHWIRS